MSRKMVGLDGGVLRAASMRRIRLPELLRYMMGGVVRGLIKYTDVESPLLKSRAAQPRRTNLAFFSSFFLTDKVKRRRVRDRNR